MRDWLEKQLDLFEPEIVSFRDYMQVPQASSTYTDGSEWIQDSNIYEFVREGNVYEFVGSGF